MALNASTGNTLSSRAQIETAVELSLQKPATAGTAAVNPNAVVVCLGCAKKLAFSVDHHRRAAVRLRSTARKGWPLSFDQALVRRQPHTHSGRGRWRTAASRRA